MAPAIKAEVDARKTAEQAILELLRDARGPVRVYELLSRVTQKGIDAGTARRAVWRLAASRRAMLQPDFSLTEA
jgi:hypothetical protein